MAEELNPKLNETDSTSTSRALVVVTPRTSAFAERPLARFVTQLIACDRHLGAYRTARRAAPAEAASLYGTPAPVPARATLRRVV